ncbi:hypothetical protein Q0Z83_110230 [Actinoplanes sichuanensis]|uniref:Apea-like HEPN domain-containing protein n=1 Tax=Actinoplanes sichuanensis TaxID=512349 RepID=A0ABW4A242_9ACTN|nr:hypothetical protein [Actinoplanes sichuanensis]BEL12832.1 hypothetical protein Q0Z83_110230 [Actinoplanes sichuanensis]
MSWSLSVRATRNPELVDAVLLAAGKSLYIANAFEAKCKSVLQIFNLVTAVEADSIRSLEDTLASLPPDRKLHQTIQGILAHEDFGDRASVSEVLGKAREARNFIAHEGMNVGLLPELRAVSLAEHAARLRSAVSDLAVGDNLVSTWCYEISEREPAPSIRNHYPEMVDGWIFGELDRLLESVDFSQDRELTIREALQRRKAASSGS